MLDKRRRTTRSLAARCGSIILPDSPDWRDCLVWDHNEHGAVVRMDFRTKLPANLILSIPSLRLAKACWTAWSDGQIHGLKFIPDVCRSNGTWGAFKAPTPPAPPLMTSRRT